PCLPFNISALLTAHSESISVIRLLPSSLTLPDTVRGLVDAVRAAPRSCAVVSGFVADLTWSWLRTLGTQTAAATQMVATNIEVLISPSPLENVLERNGTVTPVSSEIQNSYSSYSKSCNR